MSEMKASDQTQLRALINTWTRAVEGGDLEGVVAAHGRDMVMFDAPGPLSASGLPAYRKAWAGFFKVQPKGKFRVRALKLVADGDVAFAHALLTIGQKKTFQARLTVGFRKVRGRWLIVHEHHSCID